MIPSWLCHTVAVSGGGALWSAVHGADTAEGLLDPGTTYQYRARALNTVATAGDTRHLYTLGWRLVGRDLRNHSRSRSGRADAATSGGYHRPSSSSRLGSQRQLDHDQVDPARPTRRRRYHQLRGLGGHCNRLTESHNRIWSHRNQPAAVADRVYQYRSLGEYDGCQREPTTTAYAPGTAPAIAAWASGRLQSSPARLLYRRQGTPGLPTIVLSLQFPY